MNNNKHEFDKCPDCGVDVSKTDSLCWSCNTNLETIHNKINDEITIKKLHHREKNRLKRERFSKKLDLNPKKLLGALLIIVIAFIVINLVTFTYIFTKTASSGINVKGKAYMSAASVVTMMYVTPAFQIFRIDFPPKYWLESFRDYLFDKGAENIPEDDGETYIWWFVIKYPQFAKGVKPDINDYADKNEFNRSEEEIQRYLNWTNQFYKGVEALSKLKIKDKEFRERRLNVANALTLGYVENRFITMASYLQRKTDTPGRYWLEDSEINNLKKLFHIYNKVFEYCKNNEKENYDYFFNKTERHMYHYIVNKSLTENILFSFLKKNEKEILRKTAKLNCDNEYINTYGDSWDALLNVYKYRLTTHIDGNNWAWATSYGNDARQIVKFCPANKHLDALRNYIEERDN